MGFKMTAKNSQGFEIPEAGNQPAVLVAIVDLGTQKQEYQGTISSMRRVLFAWELTDQPMSGSSKNHVLGKDYSLSFGTKAALRQMLERWRGKPFADGEEMDLEALLGKPCLVDVLHGTSKTSGKSYAKVGGVSALPRGMEAPTALHKPAVWTIDDNDRLPEHLAPWLPFVMGKPALELIRHSPEWLAKAGKADEQDGSLAHEQDEDDDIPF